jgi:hypothetical protein
MIASSGLGSLWVIFRLGFAMVIGFDGPAPSPNRKALLGSLFDHRPCGPQRRPGGRLAAVGDLVRMI